MLPLATSPVAALLGQPFRPLRLRGQPILPCPLSFSNLPPSGKASDFFCPQDEKGKFDELIEDKGVKILIDPKALMHIKMDFVDDKLRSEFMFINPNSEGQCGCGQSFMTTSAAQPSGKAGSKIMTNLRQLKYSF